MTEQLKKIMGKPMQYVKPEVAEARMKEHGKNLDRESFTEGLSHLPTISSKLKRMKERCDEAGDETACDAYEIAVNGNGGNRVGIRQMWENDGNLDAKAILEELGEL